MSMPLLVNCKHTKETSSTHAWQKMEQNFLQRTSPSNHSCRITKKVKLFAHHIPSRTRFLHGLHPSYTHAAPKMGISTTNKPPPFHPLLPAINSRPELVARALHSFSLVGCTSSVGHYYLNLGQEPEITFIHLQA